MKSPLKVTKIDIDRVMGLEEFDLQASPDWNIIRGRNGAGKTSAIEAIKNVFSGGSNLANLARIAPDGSVLEPKVVIVLQGEGVERYEITKTAKGVKIKERVGQTAAMKEIDDSPGKWLSRMFDAQAASPAKFLLADEKEQLSIFLAALPVAEFTPEIAKGLVGEFWPAVEKNEVPFEFLHPLQALAAVRLAIYNSRTGVNASYRAKLQAAQEDLLDAPAEIPESVEHLISAARAELSALETQHGADTSAIESDLKAETVAPETERHNATEEALRVENETIAKAVSARNEAFAEAERVYLKAQAEADKACNDAMLKAKQECANLSALAAEKCNKDIAGANRKAEARRAEIADRAVAIEKKRTRIAELDAQQAECVRAQTKRESAARREAEAESFKDQYDRMTAVIDKLDAHKETMAEEIPIKGLTIEGGLKVNGVPFAQCNTATRVKVAFHVGMFRSQRLRAMFLDSFECLDAESREELLRLAQEHDVQLFAAEVSDSDLAVTKAE